SDIQSSLGHHAAVAATQRARIGDDFASAAATATVLLYAEEALCLDNHTASAAALASRRPSAAATAAPGAFAAQFFARDRDRSLDASCCFNKIQFDFDFAIAATLRTRPDSLPKKIPEQVAEQVEHRLGIVEVGDVQPLQPGVPVAIVALALL